MRSYRLVLFMDRAEAIRLIATKVKPEQLKHEILIQRLEAYLPEGFRLLLVTDLLEPPEALADILGFTDDGIVYAVTVYPDQLLGILYSRRQLRSVDLQMGAVETRLTLGPGTNPFTVTVPSRSKDAETLLQFAHSLLSEG